ncbi:DNA-processing protein DprA [bacterium]|nr:DNA-processing protein DprA [bacterium]
MTEETLYWAHLAGVEGVGGAIFDQLQRRFGSIKRALEAPVDEVLEIPGLDERTAEAVCRAHLTLEGTQKKLEELVQKGIDVITKMDADYPPRFRDAVNPPPLIYQLGKMENADQNAVAIIGSRECGDVSARRAREYGKYFAEMGLSVVSGYAFGVDINGHIGAIEGGGRTVIIPGCGIDVFDLKPLVPSGIEDFESLKKHAVMMTEQPPASDWSARSSLARNRLVAAHAKAILVLEARLHSSTLDTVEHAQKLGRPIFTQLFGSVSEKVMGNEKLRREGAGEIQSVDDLKKIVAAVMESSDSGSASTDDDDLRR